ncbi:hypothetical protein JCM16303_004575 [Sporobolomyces ruberrimus]
MSNSTPPPSAATSSVPAKTTTSPPPTAPSSAPKPETVTPKTAATKPKKRSRKPLRRRGAKQAADEEEEEEANGSKPVRGEGGDDASSDSDFDPDSGRSDESEEEEEEEEDEPVQNGLSKNGDSTAPPTQFDEAQAVNPAAWSDMPQDGEAGSSQLPELDFAGLSVSKLDALPTVPNGASFNGEKVLSKKESILQQRIQKSEDLKKKDPEAWEKQETERKEREEAKRFAKKERQKEKNKAKKVALREKRETDAANGTEETTNPRPAPVPARPSKTALALGLTKSEPSIESPASTDPVASTSNGSRANASSTNQPPRLPRSGPPGAPPVDYTRAREAYTQRLATDPAYIPKVGKFWGHDDRLASPEVRPLNPFWRGGRGGAGARGRGGAVRGGRGAFAQRGPDRWTADGKIVGEENSESGKENAQVAQTGQEEEKPKELDAEDKWGRGESKRAQKPSEFASMPGWNHAGFEELEREEEERAARGPSPSASRGAKRGVRGGAARGRGAFGGRGGMSQGAPGAINPRYAHLPFHPLHRFPPATLPPAQPAATPTAPSAVDPAAPVEPTTVQEVPTSTETTRPGNVRLPSTGVAAAQFALAVRGATVSRAVPEETAPEPATETLPTEGAPVVPEHAPVPSPSIEVRKQQGASILYAADPSRVANSVPREDTVSPASSFSAFQQQQMHAAPPPHLPYQHQLPPHLQSQGVPPPFIPRHSSPAFYPNPAQPSYYPIDSYGSMSSPSSATPPPQLFSPPPTSSFFLPPRSSRVEIKAPSRDGDSPAPARQAIISTNNTAYAIASQQHESNAAGSASPASAREGGGIPLPPSSPPFQHQHHNPYSVPPPYAYSQMQQPQSFSPYEYPVQSYQPQYHQNPYAVQNQHVPSNYYAHQQHAPHLPPPHHQAYSYYPMEQHSSAADPAILSMGGARHQSYQPQSHYNAPY